MMVGIVAEGKSDIAVIRNILKGKLGIERDETTAIRPELVEDKTDLSAGFSPMRAEQYSNWGLVLEECRAGVKIRDFLGDQQAVERFVVVHIDTAEAEHPGYDIARPDRSAPDYSDRLRALVVAKIDALLGPDLAAGVRHAVAIEETDAWMLTIHDDQGDRDTGARPDPKKRLRFVLEREASKGKARAKKSRDDTGRERKKSEYEQHFELSAEFRDRGKLDACAQRNRSLRLFVDSLTPPG